MQVKLRLGHPLQVRPLEACILSGLALESLGGGLGKLSWRLAVGVIENGNFTPLGVEPKPGGGPLGTVPE